ncbi:hypothetical protein HDV64DRAFT_20549 [Trichoderma sp. TUCIM 5745]
MAPSSTAVGSLLRQVVYYHLDSGSYDNALFFAERYAAQDPRSSEAAYLYSLCHLRLGDNRSAYDVSKPMGFRGVHLGCTWVFAQACLALERYKDGIAALDKAKGSWSQKNTMGKHSATTRAAYPDAPAVLGLLGKLYRGYDDKNRAVSCFEEALKLNAFQWDAFKALCDMGVKLRVPNIFMASDSLLQNLGQDLTTVNAELSMSVSTSMNQSQSQSQSQNQSQSTIANSFEQQQPQQPPKKSSVRPVVADMGPDPFGVSFSAADMTPMTENMLANTESDFMSRMQNARFKLKSSSNHHQNDMEGLETPTGPPAEAMMSRSNNLQEPPHAPARRTRNAQHADQTLEAPPRMNHRLGSRKNATAREKNSQEQPLEAISDTPSAHTGNSRSSAMSTTDRKRTLAGHPVSRSTNMEEHATRRSARLIKPSGKPNSTATTPAAGGAPGGRELKKARPPVSRMMRPGSGGSNAVRVVSGNRKPLEDYSGEGEYDEVKARQGSVPPSKVVEHSLVKFEEALRWVMDLMKKLGSGYFFLSQFQCQEALQALGALPAAHQSSPWVLALMGRAHYEQASYAEADQFFRRMRAQCPSRLEDMEVYSTILWHLKQETDLSFLAHELVDAAWHSPQAWCALGNAWSLARDPEQALKCFKRATQLDPKFAYGFTLQGHEHVTNEEYDKALTAYRQAISADQRHYNAYYGIGRVHQRLGAYDKALTHFQAAHVINPNNAVLVTCIGTALEKQKQIFPAVRAYTKAVELAPQAASARYKRARALLLVGQIEEAQRELVILKDMAPDEGMVHYLLGHLYRSMNERQEAVRHYTIALALDPKAGPQIKEAIESFEDDVPMDDSMI